MKHIIENIALNSILTIDETLCENTSLSILDADNMQTTHYLTPKDLKNLIGVLLHIQAKKRKQGADFDKLSSSF